jgi:hypothetical protein
MRMLKPLTKLAGLWKLGISRRRQGLFWGAGAALSGTHYVTKTGKLVQPPDAPVGRCRVLNKIWVKLCVDCSVNVIARRHNECKAQ